MKLGAYIALALVTVTPVLSQQTGETGAWLQ